MIIVVVSKRLDIIKNRKKTIFIQKDVDEQLMWSSPYIYLFIIHLLLPVTGEHSPRFVRNSEEDATEMASSHLR